MQENTKKCNWWWDGKVPYVLGCLIAAAVQLVSYIPALESNDNTVHARYSLRDGWNHYYQLILVFTVQLDEQLKYQFPIT